jgi:hypothetical protein
MQAGHMYTLPSGRQIPVIDGRKLQTLCKADQKSDLCVSAEPHGQEEHCWNCAQTFKEGFKKRCIKCDRATYCCLKCQYADYELHKLHCESMAIRIDE